MASLAFLNNSLSFEVDSVDHDDDDDSDVQLSLFLIRFMLKLF